MLFGYAMNDIGDDTPYHEAVGLVDTDGSVGLVPGNEPAEGSAFVDLELLDGKLAIYEGYDEVAVGWFYLAVDVARSPSRMPAPVMLSPDMRT